MWSADICNSCCSIYIIKGNFLFFSIWVGRLIYRWPTNHHKVKGVNIVNHVPSFCSFHFLPVCVANCGFCRSSIYVLLHLPNSLLKKSEKCIWASCAYRLMAQNNYVVFYFLFHEFRYKVCKFAKMDGILYVKIRVRSKCNLKYFQN